VAACPDDGQRDSLTIRKSPSRYLTGGRTVAQLRNEARQRGLRGYSRMRKADLERRLGR